MKCPICDNLKFRKVFNLYDDRYGEPNLYSIKECTQCGHYCTFPRINNNQLPSLYGNFYPRKNINLESIVKESKKESSKFSGFFRWLKGTNNQGQFYAKKDDLFLDIGCGSGVSLIEAENLGAKAFGLEADPNVKIIGKNLNLNIFQGNLEESPFKDNKFNLIVLNQVIEHIPEPDILLKKLAPKLSKNGMIIISFPNLNSFWRFIFKERWINWHVPYHLHHFKEKNFGKLLNKYGFQIIKKKSITPNIWSLMQIRNILNPIKIGEKNKQWLNYNSLTSINKNDKDIIDKIKILLKTLIKILILSPITILNRFIDLFGIGDSLMFFIKIKN